MAAGLDLTNLPLQVYLLAEILKAVPVPSHVLFGLIRDANIQPRWNDTALPPGMCLYLCTVAFYQAPVTCQVSPGFLKAND